MTEKPKTKAEIEKEVERAIAQCFSGARARLNGQIKEL
jgi:hypothetical protein